MPNAIEMLTADHEKMRALLPKLSDSSMDADARKELLGTIEKELKIHSMLEEEIFYPAFRDAVSSEKDRDMYFEAIEEHHVVDMLLPEMKPLDASSDGFRAKGTVLRELVEHHAGEEETDMFPKAAELLGDNRLMALGSEMFDRKKQLEAEWDNVLAGAMRKVQSLADKFLPSAIKEARGAKHEAEKRDE